MTVCAFYQKLLENQTECLMTMYPINYKALCSPLLIVQYIKSNYNVVYTHTGANPHVCHYCYHIPHIL